MRVIQFMRKPDGLAFSVENLFADIQEAIEGDIDVSVYTNPYHSRGLFRRLAGLVRASLHQSDVNHITGDIQFLGILMRKRRTVLTVLDCVTLERLTGIRYWVLWFFWYWLPAKRAAVITVISESTKRELLRHLGRGSWPIKVIHCPVSLEFRHYPKVFDSHCPTILQVGTKSNKNIERVAAALEGIRCRLVVIGKLKPEQIAALEENGVDYESHAGISRSALIEHYRNCDLLVFASLYEGFGLPVLEAQATGRPVVTSGLYSMPEVAGKGALYVDPLSASAIGDAVRKIIDDAALRDRLVTAGARNVEKFRPAHIASQYAEIYRSVFVKAAA